MAGNPRKSAQKKSNDLVCFDHRLLDRRQQSIAGFTQKQTRQPKPAITKGRLLQHLVELIVDADLVHPDSFLVSCSF